MLHNSLKKGEDAKSDPRILSSLNSAIDDLECKAISEPLRVLSWMIADELLDIRIAVPTAKLDGDFHIKIGVFKDSKGDYIAFNGSPNETIGGFRNFESLHIHLGWTHDRDAIHAKSIVKKFDKLWEEHDPNVRCYKLPIAIHKRLDRYAKRTQRPYDVQGRPTLLTQSKWKHQDDALAAFMSVRSGVLAMATGTGKTRTALKIDAELRERALVQFTIIAAFGTDLLEQWYNELINYNPVDLIYRFYNIHHEADQFRLSKRSACLLINRRNLAKIIPRLSSDFIAKTIIICDEVHGFGENSLVASLNGKLRQFPYRLGLSATPTREYDYCGNEFIQSEIGPIIFRFEIHEAIKRGILCEFDYHSIEFEYSDEDRSEVQAAFARQRRRELEGNNDPKHLYMDLARIKKLSKQKIPPFESYVLSNPDVLKRCILFVEQANYGSLLQPLLIKQRINYHTYYGDDDRVNLQSFAQGELDCLIACKRISEGIDIQSISNIVLFSTAKAPIETVQRVGRCLRIDPNNDNKRANVVDFIRVNDDEPLSPDTPDTPLSTDEERQVWFQELSSTRKNSAEGRIS